MLKAAMDVAKATAAAVVALKVAQNTEAILTKGGALAGKAVAAGKRRLQEAKRAR